MSLPHFHKICPPPTQVASFSDDPSDCPSPLPTDDDIRNSLPLGWNPTPTPNERRPTLILVLSLVLAFVICVFIIGCVFWRKNIIKRRRRDLEAEFKKHHSEPSAAEEAKIMVEKESKAKLKILARATARWKANIRHAARQRKGKRVVTSRSSQPHQSCQASHSSNHSRSRLTVSLSSRTSSRRSSVVSLSDDLSQPIIDECPSPLPLDAISTPTISPIATSPPAYHHDGQVLPVIYSNISHTTSLDRQSSSFRANSSTNPSRAAHVATDDKTLLAHLVDLASRPPEETSTDVCDTLVSAPAWHDELEEIPLDLVNYHPPTCLASSLFPPPPSKDHMATGDHYDYSFSFEDTVALEPEPSAPPFHLDSAPPPDDHQIVPSAPPLLDDTEFLVGVHPSAPQLDVGEDNPAGQDHDRMSPLPSSANVPSLSASRWDIGASNDIALPGYRP